MNTHTTIHVHALSYNPYTLTPICAHIHTHTSLYKCKLHIYACVCAFVTCLPLKFVLGTLLYCLWSAPSLYQFSPVCVCLFVCSRHLCSQIVRPLRFVSCMVWCQEPRFGVWWTCSASSSTCYPLVIWVTWVNYLEIF